MEDKLNNPTRNRPRIKAMFQFINFLHSNIDCFKAFNVLIDELLILDKERQKLKPLQKYTDKLRYDELEALIHDKFTVLKTGTYEPIKAKAVELNVCDFKQEPLYSWNGIETEIRDLKEKFKMEDLPEIFKHKNQYLEYRNSTHKTLLSLGFFFDELDEVLKTLFDYFKDTEEDEFEAFESRTIPSNGIHEAIELMMAGNNKIQMPKKSSDFNLLKSIPQLKTHEKLYKIIIFSVDEKVGLPIRGAYEYLKEIWFFLNSDSATFNGKEVGKEKRPLLINPVIVGTPDYKKFFDAEITYCSRQNKIKLIEVDFVNDISAWIERKSSVENLPIVQKRKYTEFLAFLRDGDFLSPSTIANPPKYTAKHYVLAYLFECNAKGESFPNGNKQKLERIGNERMGARKGNRFYKVFNEIVHKDLNVERELIDIAGASWREAILYLSQYPELVESYLQSKQL